MKQRILILLFGLGFFLGVLVLTGSTAQPAQARNTFQDNPCAGLTPEEIRAGGVTVLQCKLHCQEILPAGDPNAWSDEELWSCINQSGGQPGDQPGEDVPPTTPLDQPDLNSACAGVTPEDFRSDSQEVTECRLLCSQSWQSDEELWACIEYYGGQPGDQPGEDVPPITPWDQTDSGQPANLGPMATTPLVPLAGALIGTVIGWLVSVATTSGNVLKTLVTPPVFAGCGVNEAILLTIGKLGGVKKLPQPETVTGWCVYKQEQTLHGPLRVEELRSKLDSQQVPKDILIWSTRATTWLSVADGKGQEIIFTNDAAGN